MSPYFFFSAESFWFSFANLSNVFFAFTSVLKIVVPDISVGADCLLAIALSRPCWSRVGISESGLVDFGDSDEPSSKDESETNFFFWVEGSVSTLPIRL